jgi:hypothetical protein
MVRYMCSLLERRLMEVLRFDQSSIYNVSVQLVSASFNSFSAQNTTITRASVTAANACVTSCLYQ